MHILTLHCKPRQQLSRSSNNQHSQVKRDATPSKIASPATSLFFSEENENILLGIAARNKKCVFKQLICEEVSLMWWDEALNSNKMSQKDTTQQLKRHKKKAVAATEDPAKTPISLQLYVVRGVC